MAKNALQQSRLIHLHLMQVEVLQKMREESCTKLLSLYAELYGQYTLEILSIHGEDETLQAVFGKKEDSDASI